MTKTLSNICVKQPRLLLCHQIQMWLQRSGALDILIILLRTGISCLSNHSQTYIVATRAAVVKQHTCSSKLEERREQHICSSGLKRGKALVAMQDTGNHKRKLGQEDYLMTAAHMLPLTSTSVGKLLGKHWKCIDVREKEIVARLNLGNVSYAEEVSTRWLHNIVPDASWRH